MSGPNFKDVTGTPRPQRDIEAALKYVEAEMMDNANEIERPATHKRSPAPWNARGRAPTT